MLISNFQNDFLLQNEEKKRNLNKLANVFNTIRNYSTNRKLSYCVSSLSFQIFCVYFMIQEQEDLKELGKTEFASSEQIDL